MTLAVTRRPCSDNFHAGRDDPRTGLIWQVDQITIHVTEGDRGSVRSWFNTKTADVSAHYMVCTDGSIDQFVDEDDVALHNGVVVRPTAPLVLERPGVNPNLYSIGIEHEGDGKHILTPKQRDASLELMLTIRARHPRVALSRRHIVGHHEVRATKTCPGLISVDALVADLRRISLPARLKPPIVVWSEYAGDYLVATRIVSDVEWFFVPMKAVGRLPVTRATVPLSSMPLVAS